MPQIVIPRVSIKFSKKYKIRLLNNEIITSSVTNKIGSSLPYYKCLHTQIEKKEQTHPASLHTVQGSVYSSSIFLRPQKLYQYPAFYVNNRPTNYPVLESLNGWIEISSKEFAVIHITLIGSILDHTALWM